MTPYSINVSAIQQYAKCPFRWWAQYVMNWIPREEPEPLAFGRMLHQIFEAHARGISMPDAIHRVKYEWTEAAMKTTDTFENAMRMKALSKLVELEEALVQWKDKYEFDIPVLEVEQTFEIPHPDDSNIILCGRPDRVAVHNNTLWHVQNRGLAAGTNFGIYLEIAKRHYHEHVYAEALSRKYIHSHISNNNWQYGGTFFNLVRKLKYRTKVTKKNPQGEVKNLEEMFFQSPMSIDLKSPLHKHVMDSVLWWAKRMREDQILWDSGGVIPAPNEDANGGRYGNSPDVYFRVLTGDIELGDERYFKQRVDPYAMVSTDES